MPAAAEHLAVAHDHATYAGVAADAVEAVRGEFDGAAEEQAVGGADHGCSDSVFSRAISFWKALMSWKSRYTEAKRT